MTLAGQEAAHILRARRMRPGEVFELQDPRGRRFTVEREAATGRAVTVKVLAAAALPPQPRMRLTLLQGAVKEKAAEAILRQVTELGVERLIVLHALHASGRQGNPDAPRLLQRWGRSDPRRLPEL